MITQKQLVLQYLKDFGSITSIQAFADLGITRLAARISDLKDVGVYTKKETITSKNRYGKTVHFAKYSLLEEDEDE